MERDGQQSPELRTSHPTGANVEMIGDVVCRLDGVLLAAKRQYGLDITMLHDMTHIDRRVLEALDRDKNLQYDLRVFERLCYVFDVTLGTFLEYLTPEQLAQKSTTGHRPEEILLPVLSLRTPLPEDCGQVRCLLQQVLERRQQDFLTQLGKPGKRHVSYPDLESLWGIKAQRLADWANNVPTRYHRSTMAELCHALHLGVDDIWRYDSPAMAAHPSSIPALDQGK